MCVALLLYIKSVIQSIQNVREASGNFPYTLDLQRGALNPCNACSICVSPLPNPKACVSAWFSADIDDFLTGCYFLRGKRANTTHVLNAPYNPTIGPHNRVVDCKHRTEYESNQKAFLPTALTQGTASLQTRFGRANWQPVACIRPLL